jgi:hypothetical protein
MIFFYSKIKNINKNTLTGERGPGGQAGDFGLPGIIYEKINQNFYLKSSPLKKVLLVRLFKEMLVTKVIQDFQVYI